MNFRLFNYVQGVTSLVRCWGRRPFREAARESLALAHRRAREWRISPERALELDFHERRAGQVGYAVFTVSLLAGLLVLAANHAAPEWAMCLLAVVPGITLLASLWLERLMRTRWSI
ncbi:hypothetical protein [Burkholderia ubonensis]|uniref:hypothetical protein n=1 Tax=Burkholderia ubonensis TaxID=101571 RepID=UPI00075408DD|nr:hypothetical protein [Burkholderia ubonensis]KVP39690.1 hypothetical protein WJ87_05765 [Burkholderia ubonensis]